MNNQYKNYGISFNLYSLTPIKKELTGVAEKCTSKSLSKLILHKYGQGPFCEFSAPKEIEECKGIYIFIVNGIVKYVGRCQDNFKTRITQGYGHISPRNCYKGGQLTNCHVNMNQ